MRFLIGILLLLQDPEWTKLRARLDGLADEDPALRKAAREGLPARETLLKAPREHRETAALALGVLGEPKAKETLVEMTKTAATRAAAFEALGGLKVDPRFFIDALTGEPRVAFAAARALGRTDPARLERVYDDATSRGRDSTLRRLACAQALAFDRASPVLRRAMKDSDPALASVAFLALAQLDGLDRLPHSADEDFRAFVARADLEPDLVERAALLWIRLDLAETADLAALLASPSAKTRAAALDRLTPAEPHAADVGRWLEWMANEKLGPDERRAIESWTAKATGAKEGWTDWWKRNRYSSILAGCEKAAAKGADWLDGRREQGRWREKWRGEVGLTALAVYTRLKCGRADVKAPLEWLAGQDLHSESGEGGTYRASAMALAFAEAGELKLLADAAKYLQAAQRRDGSWGYFEGDKEHGDVSNTQLAVVALRAAKTAGVKVAPAAFSKGADWLSRARLKDGGWAYTKEESYTAMTAAGLCAWLTARTSDPKNGMAAALASKEAADAVAWLETNWSIEGTRPKNASYFYMASGSDPYTSQFSKGTGSPFVGTNYTLWCLERACMVAGLEKIGGHDWFIEGADLLLSRRRPSGEFRGPLGIADHCFALLFLKRAYVPVPSGDK